MITLFLVAAATIGFLGGSLWLFTAAIGFLLVKMFPILLVVLAIAGAAFLAFNHYYRN
jgi:hypothetical protein